MKQSATGINSNVVFATNTDGGQCYSSEVPLFKAESRNIVITRVYIPWVGEKSVSDFTIQKGYLGFNIYTNNSATALEVAGKNAQITFSYS